MEKLECPSCKSKNILTNRKSGIRICRRCGADWIYEIKQKGESQMKKLRNNKGIFGAIPLVSFAAWGLITLATGKAVVETAQNGTLKNNGKIIWCKMQNKGADYCDAKYAQ